MGKKSSEMCHKHRKLDDASIVSINFYFSVHSMRMKFREKKVEPMSCPPRHVHKPILWRKLHQQHNIRFRGERATTRKIFSPWKALRCCFCLCCVCLMPSSFCVGGDRAAAFCVYMSVCTICTRWWKCYVSNPEREKKLPFARRATSQFPPFPSRNVVFMLDAMYLFMLGFSSSVVWDSI